MGVQNDKSVDIEGSTLMLGSVCPLVQRGEPQKYDIVILSTYYGRCL